MNIHSAKAGGNISPSRFVKITATGTVSQTGDAEICDGISQAGTRRVALDGLDDGYAAIAGYDIEYFGDNAECLLELGGTVTIGQRIESDADGKGVASTADGAEYGATCLKAGISGDLVPVRVHVRGMRAA